MRRIVTRGLYTFMEGMSSGTVLSDKDEKNEPLKQTRSKSLEAPYVNGHGKEEVISQNSPTTPTLSRDLAYRLKFMAWQRINSHRKQRQAALASETRKSDLI